MRFEKQYPKAESKAENNQINNCAGPTFPFQILKTSNFCLDLLLTVRLERLKDSISVKLGNLSRSANNN